MAWSFYLPLQRTSQAAATRGQESAAYLGKESAANLGQTVANGAGRLQMAAANLDRTLTTESWPRHGQGACKTLAQT